MSEIKVGVTYSGISEPPRKVLAIIPKYSWDKFSTALSSKNVQYEDMVEGGKSAVCALYSFAKWATEIVKE